VKLLAGLLIVTAGAALAQRHAGFARSHAPFSGFGSRSGFGNVVFPGTGRPPVGSITDPNFSARLGANVGGFLNYTGVAHGTGRGRGVVYVPWVWPMYGGYVNPYPQEPNVIVIQQPQAPVAQQPAPQVVINNYADPNARPYEPVTTYQAPARPPVSNAPDPAYYLIAFKDNTIYSAVAYWVEGDTLHYITSGNVRNQVSLDLVDTRLTEQLNKDRNVQVRLK
jgi:hypothetical protein